MARLEQKTLGTTEITVSPMGMGCWAIGGPFTLDGKQDNYGHVDDQVSKRAIHEAVMRGITFFDTADVYGIGRSERILGEVLHPYRKDVVIATKFGFTYSEEQRAITGENISPEYIRKACEASLRRLKTDYIDLYQLHIWAIPLERIDTVIETLERLQSAGWIRTYGWSTGDPECAAYSPKSPKQPPSNIR